MVFAGCPTIEPLTDLPEAGKAWYVLLRSLQSSTTTLQGPA
jgi:hypothetical protein